jgi:uracil permease
MFPATVLVALLCGFHPSTVLFGAGVSTIVALILSKRGIGMFIPLFYGSSFSYIAAYLGIAQAMGHKVQFGVPAPDEVISLMQAGIVCTGLLNVVVGFAIKKVGKAKLDRVLPPVVTGSVACVIGIGLAKAALDMSLTVVPGYWGIAFVTLIATVAFSYLLQGKGFIGMLPILLGAIVGYLLTLVVAPDQISFKNVAEAPLIAAPHLTLPSFSGPLLLTAIFSISIMALATIPESTAHLYQISLYVDRLAEEQARPKYHLDKHVGFNLILDGIGDVLHGLFGATAGTNYGENNSLMAITRNYSGPALMAAGVICILLAFVGKLSAFVATIPVFVSGGLALYLFGVIGMQGIALIQENKVNLFDPLQLAVGAVIMVIGIGGNIGFQGGFLPITIPGVFPQGLPAIATSAVVGILMYVIFTAIKSQPVTRDAASVAPMP